MELSVYGADGMLAVFGSQSDHARRGLSAAMSLRQRLRDALTNAKAVASSAYSVSQGLHSGPVAVGHLTGETPNLAIWFQHQAAPDTILFSAATMRLVEDIASDAEQNAIRVPGYTDVMAAYRLGNLQM